MIADRRRVIGMIISFLPDFEHPEVVTTQDIRMLASLRLRRLGRQWARLNLGIDGRHAMTQYQLAATELAMACHRKSLGQTTEDAFVRHRDDSLTLMRAAAAIVRRQEQLYPPPWIAPTLPPSSSPTDRTPASGPLRWPYRSALATHLPELGKRWLAEEGGLEVGERCIPPRGAAATPCGPRPSRTRSATRRRRLPGGTAR